MGIFDKTPLPDTLDEAGEWKGTDDDQVWWMRWRLYVKNWFAFSDRSPSGIAFSFVYLPLIYVLPFSIWFTGWTWWYLFPLGIIPVSRKWRTTPLVVFAVKGGGPWRLEKNGIGAAPLYGGPPAMLFPRIEEPAYLSRIQYWCRWHVAIHWPFLITWNFYFHAADVPKPGEVVNADGKVFSGYRGWHYDADNIFWGDGAGAGNFK